MRTGQVKLNFIKIEQAIQYEISRFPFAANLKKQELRKAYRDLEANFRDSVRSLDLLDSGFRITGNLLGAEISKIESAIKNTSVRYEGQLGVDLKENLERLCEALSQIAILNTHSEPTPAQIEELSCGFEVLKRSLSTVHKL